MSVLAGCVRMGLAQILEMLDLNLEAVDAGVKGRDSILGTGIGIYKVLAACLVASIGDGRIPTRG